MEIFVNCPKGLESLLKEELDTLGAAQTRETVAGVYASGAENLPYIVCLWSRLANRVLLPLAKFDVPSAEALYDGVQTVYWGEHLSTTASFAVDFTGRNDAIRHSQFGAQKIKDAIVDQLVAETGRRPEVDLKHPDIRINAYLSKNQLALSLDLSGESLHRRGYRLTMVPAPLKENLAAAILVRAGWPQILKEGGSLIDPMCGSGTLLIEAAMMATDTAPGLWRQHYGFRAWQHYDPQLWAQLQEDAKVRHRAGLALELPEIRGYDKDSRAIAACETNVAAAGLESVIRVMAKPVAALKKPTHKDLGKGLLVTNPPYGERWGDIEGLKQVYEDLGRVAKTEFGGWTLGVFTGNMELASELRLRADKSYSLYNGTIAAKLFLYSLRTGDGEQMQRQEPRPLSENESMLANRLAKNAKRLKSWLKKTGITCYRLYDQDLPEYAVAIDIYGDAFHIQEYAPPATIDNTKAQRRIREVRRVLTELYPQSKEKLFFKERRRQSGDSQYQPLSPWNQKAEGFVVNEGQAKLEVNLRDYLDSGLFLDHRPVREMLAAMARGKRFLNLFCYTAAATVQAALGGAKSSRSIDMSNTYLDWAKRNFALNNLDASKHQLLRADCLEWLEAGEGQYDLIFLDPPTFSNSKKMSDVLDIQRDHATLIENAMAILAPKGILVFSNNFRRFKMDDLLFEKYRIEDISAQSIPTDFQRNQKIHNCWRISHADK